MFFRQMSQHYYHYYKNSYVKQSKSSCEMVCAVKGDKKKGKHLYAIAIDELYE